MRKNLRGIKTINELLNADSVSESLSEIDKVRNRIDDIVIIGTDKSGGLFVSGNFESLGDCLLILEKAKAKIVEGNCDLL